MTNPLHSKHATFGTIVLNFSQTSLLSSGGQLGKIRWMFLFWSYEQTFAVFFLKILSLSISVDLEKGNILPYTSFHESTSVIRTLHNWTSWKKKFSGSEETEKQTACKNTGGVQRCCKTNMKEKLASRSKQGGYNKNSWKTKYWVSLLSTWTVSIKIEVSPELYRIEIFVCRHRKVVPQDAIIPAKTEPRLIFFQLSWWNNGRSWSCQRLKKKTLESANVHTDGETEEQLPWSQEFSFDERVLRDKVRRLSDDSEKYCVLVKSEKDKSRWSQIAYWNKRDSCNIFSRFFWA